MECTQFTPYSFLYHFRDPLGVNFTLIKGSNLAILFDTGYGFLDIKTRIESLINTPYIVINSHGHMDHTGGNFLFDKVYISEEDYQLCIKHNSVERRTLNVKQAMELNLISLDFDVEKYINQTCDNLEILDLNRIYDLGNMTVKIIPMPGHTKGSVGLLIEEHKLLLTGDAAISNIWLFLEESTGKDYYIKMLERVKNEDFDYFLTGHLNKIFPKYYFDYYLEVAKEANKNNSKKIIYKHFERDNTYQYTKQYNSEVIGINFHEE